LSFATYITAALNDLRERASFKKGAKQMKTSSLTLWVLFAGCVVFAACSQATQLSHFQYTPNVNSVHRARGDSLSYTLLYMFARPPNDGSNPYAGVTDVGGTLYGTTQVGGTSNDGTVYR
jgi:hypothetical protein